MEDVVDRVDELVRHNLARHARDKNQQAAEKEIQGYQNQRKKDALRFYSEMIKERNRRIVECHKEKNKKKKVKKARPIEQPEMVIGEQQEEPKKPKLRESQIKDIESAIESRAQRILQENELGRLNKFLAQEKKKTKLHQLDQRCRKLAKSSVKAVYSGETEPRKKALQQFQRKAIKEIEDLDKVIMSLVSKSKTQEGPKLPVRQPSAKARLIHEEKEQAKGQMEGDGVWVGQEHPLFVKSSQELLSLQYIPI